MSDHQLMVASSTHPPVQPLGNLRRSWISGLVLTLKFVPPIRSLDLLTNTDNNGIELGKLTQNFNSLFDSRFPQTQSPDGSCCIWPRYRRSIIPSQHILQSIHGFTLSEPKAQISLEYALLAPCHVQKWDCFEPALYHNDPRVYFEKAKKNPFHT